MANTMQIVDLARSGPGVAVLVIPQPAGHFNGDYESLRCDTVLCTRDEGADIIPECRSCALCERNKKYFEEYVKSLHSKENGKEPPGDLNT